MQHFYAPERPENPEDYDNSIFLAGSIAMGHAVEWQEAFAEIFLGENVNIFNPRRPKFDPSWVQDQSNEQFHEQVTWELDLLEDVSVVVMFFDSNVQSPITLLELGTLVTTRPETTIVCCPEGTFRKGNVDIVCARWGIKQVDTLEELAQVAREMLS